MITNHLVPTPLLIESTDIPTQEELNLSVSAIPRKTKTKKKKKKCKFKAEYIYIKKSNNKTYRKRIKEEEYYFFDKHGDLTKKNNFVRIGTGTLGTVFLDKEKIVSCSKVIEFSNKKKFDYNKKKISYLLKKTKEFHNEHIVEFLRYGYLECIDKFNLYIEMEYIGRQDLMFFLKKINPLLALKKISDGLYHLQEIYKFIHNDLKSLNIMVLFHDINNFSIKIIDLDGGHTIDDYIKKNIEIYGTPIYFSPEKLFNYDHDLEKEFNKRFTFNKSFYSLTSIEKKEYIKKQDLYSLGVILFEIIYGKNIHTLIGTFIKFPGNVKKYSFVDGIDNAYDAFLKEYPGYELGICKKKLPTFLEEQIEPLTYLLKNLLTFNERKSLKEIKEFIDSKFQVQVEIRRGGNKESNSRTNTSITSSSVSTSMSSLKPMAFSMSSPISRSSTISKTSEISENGIFFGKLEGSKKIVRIEPSLFKSTLFKCRQFK